MTRSPLAGSSDRWILDHFITDDKFLAALATSGSALEFFDLTILTERIRTTHANSPDTASAFYTHADASTADLLERLTPAQRERLPGVYMRLEGLLALCRPEFSKLFDNPTTQDNIRKLVDAEDALHFADIHRALATGVDKHDRITCHAWLRKWSSEMDWRIVQLLDANERNRLLKLVSESDALNEVIYAPPPF